MEREEIYKIIDGEREYQDKASSDPSRPDMIEDFHLGDALSAIRYNLKLAENYWYVGSVPHENAMVFLRKIAGICIMMGEKLGMPERK